jgi:hypothetical protein
MFEYHEQGSLKSTQITHSFCRRGLFFLQTITLGVLFSRLMEDEILAEIEFAQSPIPDRTLRRLDEVTIKRDGCIWRIHKNDADPFPSNPHAHNLESGLKMDLSSGSLYFGRTFTGKKVSRKDLEFIRGEATAKAVALPPLAA